jgi:hypothetical protein
VVVVVLLLLLRAPTVGAFFWGGCDRGGTAVLVAAADHHDTTAGGDQKKNMVEQQRKNHHRFTQALDSMGSGRSRSSIRKVLMVLLFSSDISGNSIRPTVVRKSTGRARVTGGGEANFIELNTIHSSTWRNLVRFTDSGKSAPSCPDANGKKPRCGASTRMIFVKEAGSPEDDDDQDYLDLFAEDVDLDKRRTASAGPLRHGPQSSISDPPSPL